MRTILGLDISTSITGSTIIQDSKIIESFIWDTRNKRKFPTLYEKAALIQADLRATGGTGALGVAAGSTTALVDIHSFTSLGNHYFLLTYTV